MLRHPTQILGAFQTLGRKAGLDIRRNGPSARDELRLAHFIKAHDIELVFDIGANRGQFAAQLFAAGYKGRIVSFEALPAAHAALSEAAAGFGDRWTVAPVGALSDRAGTTIFHVNAREATSSLLGASAAASAAIHGLNTLAQVEVQTRRLDVAAAGFGLDTHRSFLKIDVQGGEAMVLAGAQATLAKVAGLTVELSLTELYAGQSLAFELLPPLLAMGFAVHDIAPAYRDDKNFRLHQIDVVLFRDDDALASGRP